MPITLRGKVTKSAVDRLQPGEVLRDTELKGFGARRQLGAPSYFVQKKVHGRLKWITIGAHGSPWTPETARREAGRLMMSMASGRDPTEEVRAKRARRTIREISADFLADHGPRLKPRTLAEYERLFEKFINPKFGRKTLFEVARGDVASFHTSMRQTPSQANFALTAFSALYSWAEELKLTPPNSNPCRGITRFKHKTIERYLSAEEMAKVCSVLDQMEASGAVNRFALAAIRLLILTGARRSEILTLRWQDVDLPRRRICLPDSKTGQKTIHLNDGAVAVLQALPRLQGNPYVIPGHVTGSHLTNLYTTWALVRATAGLPDVRIHDLRHSFASLAVGAGASLPMIGKLLGHASPRTTARYAHLTDATLHELNQRVGDLITDAMDVGHAGTKTRK